MISSVASIRLLPPPISTLDRSEPPPTKSSISSSVFPLLEILQCHIETVINFYSNQRPVRHIYTSTNHTRLWGLPRHCCASTVIIVYPARNAKKVECIDKEKKKVQNQCIDILSMTRRTDLTVYRDRSTKDLRLQAAWGSSASETLSKYEL